MTQRQIAALACKLLGLYAIVNSLNMMAYRFILIGTIAGQTSSAASNSQFFGMNLGPAGVVILTLLPGLFMFCAGIVLIIFANGFAMFMTDEMPNEVIAIDARSLQAIAFSVAGIFILMQVVPVLANLPFSSYLARTSNIRVPSEYGPPQVVIALIKIPIGLWLLFGARGLVRLLPDIGRD